MIDLFPIFPLIPMIDHMPIPEWLAMQREWNAPADNSIVRYRTGEIGTVLLADTSGSARLTENWWVLVQHDNGKDWWRSDACEELSPIQLLAAQAE